MVGAGKTSQDCICAAGYGWNGSSCYACWIGRYKSNAGNGRCTLCPNGQVTPGWWPAARAKKAATGCIDCDGGRCGCSSRYWCSANCC